MNKDNNNEFEYFAFISYKREDEKWAKWLQQKLESYSLPTALRKIYPNLPNKIRPVFRDQSELAGGNLKSEIEKGLNSSKYLIVICSPRSANSPWVSKEIQHFIDIGKEEYIIPFIIGGVPNSTIRDNECFPKGLRQLTGEKEILGININEMGREAAFIKTISRMFNLRFDTLWQRHERAKNRRRLVMVISILVFAILSLCVAGIMLKLKTAAEYESNRANIERDRANEQTIIAQKERDNAIRANKSLQIANDSIRRQSTMIAQANQDLIESNRLIAQERDNVLKANWKIMENQSRFISAVVGGLIENGDISNARMLSLEILPENIANPNRPLTVEAERMFRMAIDNNTNTLFDNSENYPVSSLQYNHSATALATASGNKIRIWDCASGKGLMEFEIPYSYLSSIISVNYSPDDSTIAVANNTGEIFVLNINYHTVRQINSSPNLDWVTYIDFDPSGNNLITSHENGKIKIWDKQTGNVIASFQGHDHNIVKAIFSKDGKKIYSASYKGDIKVWDRYSLQLVSDFGGITDLVTFKEAHSDKFIATANMEGNIEIWDVDSKKLLSALSDKGILSNLEFTSNDRLLIATSWDKTINFWDWKNKNLERTLSPDYEVGGATLSFNDNFLATSSLKDSRIQLWNLENPWLTCFNKHENTVNTATFSNDERYVATAGWDNNIILWDKETGSIIKEFKSHSRPVHSAFFSPDDKNLISSSDDNRIIIWDVSSGKSKRIIDAHKNDIWCAKVNNKNTLIASASWDGSVKTWDIETGANVHTFSPKGDYLFNWVSFSPNDEKIAACSNEGVVFVWDINSGNLCNSWKAHQGQIHSIEFSHDGTHIITSSTDGLVKIWNTKSFLEEKTFDGQNGMIYFARFSHDDQFVISSDSNNSINIWDVKSGRMLHKINGHTSHVCFIDISKDNSEIISSSLDKTAKIWKYPKLQQLIDTQREVYKSFKFSPEERKILYLD